MNLSFRWKLRTMLMIPAIVGIAILPVVYERARCVRQRKAYERFAPDLRYLNSHSNHEIDATISTRSSWRKALLGDDSYANTLAIRAWASDVDCEDLRSLSVFPRLKCLVLDQSRIDFDGCKYIGELRALEVLSLSETGATDSDLAFLQHLSSLKRLYLSSTSIGDQGIANIRDIKKLECVDLRDTQITDAGLRHLESLANLKDLDLSGTRITIAGLISLEGNRSHPVSTEPPKLLFAPRPKLATPGACRRNP